MLIVKKFGGTSVGDGTVNVSAMLPADVQKNTKKETMW